MGFTVAICCAPAHRHPARKESPVLTSGGFQAHFHGAASWHELLQNSTLPDNLEAGRTKSHHCFLDRVWVSRCTPWPLSPLRFCNKGKWQWHFAYCKVTSLQSPGSLSSVLVSPLILVKETGVENGVLSVDARESSLQAKA